MSFRCALGLATLSALAGCTSTGPVGDGGPTGDTDPAVCGMNFAGCTTLVNDGAGGGAIVEITVPNMTTMYSPNCIQIHSGTTVFMPNSASHPLRGASCSPSASPLPRSATPDASGRTAYTFITPGAYGYYSDLDGSDTGTGMSGLIVVR